jgi:hypothetical protein
MSRLHFSFPPNLVCPDNLRFTHVDGWISLASDTASWYDKIKKHEKDNGREIAPDWKEAAQDQLCRILPPGWCSYDNDSPQDFFINTRLTVNDMKRGIEVLAAIVMSPDPLVDQPLAESRARICAACPANIVIEGCAPCMKLSEKIANIKGSGVTESDPLLKQCAACSCPSRANVWIKPELLKKGVEEEQMQKLRHFDHCWKWKEIDALP